jgi:hypothetical protein
MQGYKSKDTNDTARAFRRVPLAVIAENFIALAL